MTNRKSVFRNFVLLEGLPRKHNGGHTGEDGEEGWHDSEAVRPGQVVEVGSRHPELVFVRHDTEEQADERHNNRWNDKNISRHWVSTSLYRGELWRYRWQDRKLWTRRRLAGWLAWGRQLHHETRSQWRGITGWRCWRTGSWLGEQESTVWWWTTLQHKMDWKFLKVEWCKQIWSLCE